MKLKYAVIISAAILFLSAPAWGDSIKSNSVIHINDGFHGTFNIVSLGGFKLQDDKHVNIFKFKEGHFILIVKHDGNNDAPAPVSTPEPSALSLLLVGSVALGAFAFRRVPSLVGAR